jgi:hypothetical protein
VPLATQTATPIPVTPSLAAEPGLYFRMQSDWGSRFPQGEINFVIAAQNTRASGAMSKVRITTSMPANLEVLGASASYGVDPNLRSVPVTASGNDVSLDLDALRPSEQVIIAIKTRVKANVAVGARIISQAQLTFTGIRAPAFTNIVTVLVVGAAPTRAVAQQPSATATSAATASATASTSATAGASASATPAASPTGSAAPVPTIAPTPPPRAAAPLPDTSTGVPIFGFALLGMTLMLRTFRVHRAQSRI